MSVRRLVVAQAAIALSVMSFGVAPAHADVAALALVTQTQMVIPVTA